jgi:sec-independent protein translocase protein TatA
MEIAIVLIIALVIFGPKRLPDLGKSLGKGLREFKGSIDHDDPEPTPAAAAAPVKAPPVAAKEPEHV